MWGTPSKTLWLQRYFRARSATVESHLSAHGLQAPKPMDTLEQGDLFFVLRRRVDAGGIANLRDVQRFYLVLAAHDPRPRFRVFVVGRKHLPGGRAERGWAFSTVSTDDAREGAH